MTPLQTRSRVHGRLFCAHGFNMVGNSQLRISDHSPHTHRGSTVSFKGIPISKIIHPTPTGVRHCNSQNLPSRTPRKYQPGRKPVCIGRYRRGPPRRDTMAGLFKRPPLVLLILHCTEMPGLTAWPFCFCGRNGFEI